MLNQNFIYVAAFITVVGNAAYIKDTLKGETKPNRVTFFLWGVMPLIAFFAQKSEGGGLQALFTLTIGVIPLAILLASFVDKRAYWAITKFDIVCGSLSILAILLWVVTNRGMIALVLSIAADFFAALPTIIKSYRFPETETTAAYALEVFTALIVLLTVKEWRFVNYGFTIYVLVTNLIFTALLLRPRRLSAAAR